VNSAIKRLWLVSTLGAVSFLQIPSVSQNPPVVAGTVRRSDNLAPISSAAVTLRAQGGAGRPAIVRSVRTDFNGQFVFRDLPAGGYSIEASATGYFGTNGGSSVSEAFTLTVGQRSDLELFLDRGSVFSGRVLDSEGRPIPDVPVAYVSEMTAGLSVGQVSVGFLAKTNDEGEYRIGWIPPGEYYVRAEFPGVQPEHSNRTTHFPDAISVGNARRVIAMPGSEITGLDIQVQKSATVSISGKIVRSESGMALQLALLMYPRGFQRPVVPPWGRATVDQSTGSFEIRGVLPGSYEMVAFENTAPFVKRTYAQIAVEVGKENIEGLTLVLGPAVEVKGHITGLPNPQSVRFALNLEGVPLRPQVSTVDARGDFSFNNAVEGSSYRLYPFGIGLGGLPEGFYLRDMRQGTRSIMDTGLISFSYPGEPLEFIVSDGGGIIEGQVLGNQKSGSYVVLVPSSPRRENSALYRAQPLAAGNRFTITGVTPGSYKLFSWEGFYPSPLSLLTPEFMSRYDERGTVVRVKENERLENVRVNLIPKGQ